MSPFSSLSLLCSVDPQHFVLRQIQLLAHGTAAHGYLSDSVFNSHGTFLSLSHSLFRSLSLSNLLSSPPLMALCARTCMSPVFHPFFSLFFLPVLSLLMVVSDGACSSHTVLWNKTDTINKGTHLSGCTPELSVKSLENRALQLCDVLEIIKVPYEHRCQPL